MVSNFTNIDHPKGRYVSAAVFKVIKVDSVAVQAGQEEGVALADEADLLTLLQNFLDNVFLTINND